MKGDAHIADIIYVSTEGSDETGDGTIENPYRTIQKGIDETGRNDIVQVLPGVYEENISLLSDLVVMGSGAEDTTITSDNGTVVTAHNTYNVSISGFTIDGQGSADKGILCSGVTSEMEIRDNIVTGASVGIVCSDSVNVNIKDNTLEKNGMYGIECVGSVRATIENNTIRRNAQSGVNCSDSTNVIIDNNNLEANGWHGVGCNREATVIVINNDVRENKVRGISCHNQSVTTVKYNSIRHNGMGVNFSNSAKGIVDSNFIIDNTLESIRCTESAMAIVSRNTVNSYIGIWHSANMTIGGTLIDSNEIISTIVHNTTDNIINATYNYWGTTDESEIAAMMSNKGEGSIIFKPFINTLDEIIADASGDGTISALDAALILQYIVGIINQFPATSPIGQAAQKYVAGEITVVQLDKILQQWGYPSVFKLLGYENKLLQNYPNPFNPETWIPFKLAQNTPVTISIYDTKGQLIRTISLGDRNAGIYTTKDRSAYWDGKDKLGQSVSSGVYYYTLQAGGFRATRRMVILK